MRFRIVLFFIFLTLITINLSSYEEVLIDFNNLGDSTIDFSRMAGDFYTPEEKAQMKLDLSIKNWSIKLNQSSWNNRAREKSRLYAVDNSMKYKGITVLGIRAYFPERHANSYAIVEPPFLIPYFYEKKDAVGSTGEEDDRFTGKGNMFMNKGVVKNVGVLRKVTVNFLGNNFKYSVLIRIQDSYGNEKDIFIGYLDFVGWSTKAWINPNIEEELKRRQLKYNVRPYYPDQIPSVRFVAFIIHRTDPQVTGNFITMIKDVVIEYDEAFLEVGNTEYNQEEIFGIYREELIERAKTEIGNVDRRIFLQWIEKQKMHKEANADTEENKVKKEEDKTKVDDKKTK